MESEDLTKQRIHNKIILQTSVTSLEALYYLLDTVKQNQPLKSEDGRAKVFPQARAKLHQEKGGDWDENKRDTHTELTLAEMRFIKYTDKSKNTFVVSDVGNAFLEAYVMTLSTHASDGKNVISLTPQLPDQENLELLFNILVNIQVEQPKYHRRIKPYLILFKLLSSVELEGYISKSEWASFINDSNFLRNNQYEEIMKKILDMREKGATCELKKSDRILTRLVLWNILTHHQTDDTFCFTQAFKEIVIMHTVTTPNPQIKHQMNSITVNEDDRIDGGKNILLYGVPGSGKSWIIDNEYCIDLCVKQRVVFYPDYTYADFVGQILPQTKDGHIIYDFVPGPFTNILKEAYQKPSIRHFLIIEEINRGNAPAIFGEIFQLLDRLYSKDNKQKIKIGTSIYGIHNANIAKIVYGDSQHEIRIPSNLSILATMNTCDQNVFTLDTAFQRRWHMRLIKNSFSGLTFADKKIFDTGVSWKHFCDVMNKKILEMNSQMNSSEDKRIGAYFIDESTLTFHKKEDNITPEESREIDEMNGRFPEKVLKYLWDDAFKYSRDAIFDLNKANCLEDIVEAFLHAKGNERLEIFDDSVKTILISSSEQ